MNFYLSGWKSRQDVNIPPVKKKGFSKDVIIRKHIEPKRKLEDIVIQNKIEEKTVLIQHLEEHIDDDATVLLSERRITITVIRMKTGEKKEITKTPFIMGKANDCDFIINENPTISRRHARIRKENGDYVLEDMKSANHTYVDMREMTEPVRVMKDMVFRMSDEDFKIAVEIN